MPRKCGICQHPELDAINQALADGVSLRGISRKFFGSAEAEDALYRHKSEHLPAQLAKAHEAAEVAAADTLLARVQASHARLEQVLFTAEMMIASAQMANDRRGVQEAIRTVASVHREMRGYFDLLGELEGELNRRPEVHLHLSAEWIEVRTVLLSVLDAHPEAKAAVVTALQRWRA